MIRVLAGIFGSLLFCLQPSAAQLQEITGAVAYTEAVQFDYTKEGTRNNVQFWLEFKGSPSVGAPEDPGYKPESGAIFYYLVDMDNKKQVDNWLMGFSMMEGPPPRGPYPMTDIVINGNTASFSAFNMKWRIIDGGAGYGADSVAIDDGFNIREMKLHGGDLTVVGTDLQAIAASQGGLECMACHESSVVDILTKGGKHSSVECASCHIGHPPEEQATYTSCVECHDPHSDLMEEKACVQCHRAHTATEVRHAYNVPTNYCNACHLEVSHVLVASRSKHSDIACVRCHQDRHKDSVTCQYCHGAPHPQHVMEKPGICAGCHNTAHDLESAREPRT